MSLWLAAGSAASAGERLRVAILDADLPGAPQGLVQGLLDGLEKAGLAPFAVTCEELASPDGFSPRRADALILPHGPVFPCAAWANLLRFLRGGGDLVLLGGRAFEQPAWKVGGKWLTAEAIERQAAKAPTRKVIFDFDGGTGDRWHRGTNHPDQPTRVTAEAGKVGRCFRIAIKGLNTGWDNQGAALPAPAPEGANLLAFWAKGDERTPEMAVELAERDGSRWIAVVNLTTAWRRYALLPHRFAFWRDSRSPGRGGEGDRVRMDNAGRLVFGLATSHTRILPGDHSLWIDEVGWARLDLPDGVDPSVRLDLELFPEGEGHRLDGVRRIVPATRQGEWIELGKGVSFEGAFTGWSAVGYPLPGQGRFVPVLSAHDRHGRHMGWGVSLLVHHGGEFANSHWLLVGIETPGFVRQAGFAPMLARLLEQMRGRGLVEAARAADEREAAHRLALTTPAPRGFVRRSADGRHFVKPDGTPLFLIGCNYIGTFDRKVWSGSYTVRTLEDDFGAMAAAGLNSVRVFSAIKLLERPELREALFECARRHGIYLLMELDADGQVEFKRATRDTIRKHLAQVVEACRDEPMVLGYDLANEPYVGTVGAICFDGQPSPLVKLRPYERFAGKFGKAWVDRAVRTRPTWPKVPKWTDEDTARQLYAATALWNRIVRRYVADGGSPSTFPRLEGKLPLDGEVGELARAVDETFRLWVRLCATALHEGDPNHFVSVGYNTILECLPANEPLDFVSHHVYERPVSYGHVIRDVGTLGRLAKAWPERPITLGEFGYSNGIPVGRGYLDEHTSAIGEMMYYLFALADGHSGCMKWALADWPVPYSRRFAPWLKTEEKRVYEAGFGLYAYDGTPTGRPKPIVHALRFLREYVDAGGQGGTLTIHKTEATAIGAAYEYETDDALFIGDVTYDHPSLRFQAGQPTNLMLTWTGRSVRMLSTCDVEVTLVPAHFAAGLDEQEPRVHGRCAGVHQAGREFTLGLLAGETIQIK